VKRDQESVGDLWRGGRIRLGGHPSRCSLCKDADQAKERKRGTQEGG